MTLVASKSGWVIILVHTVRVSGENFLENVAVNIGQPTLDSVVIEGQPAMVDPQQVQDGGVEVMPVDTLVD